jgi:hypothetical protein
MEAGKEVLSESTHGHDALSTVISLLLAGSLSLVTRAAAP